MITPPAVLRSRRTFLQVAACCGATAAAASFLPSVARGASIPDLSGPASLGAHAAGHSLLYGAAVNVDALSNDPTYAQLIREQCRILVAENAMKWGALRPSPDTFHFEQADALVTFAESHGMKIRGHNLAWHRDNPHWFDAYASTVNARALLVTHIENVAGRYAGRMHSWDVVNEAVQVSDGRADGLRNSPWLRLIGDDYIEIAFQTARAADPQALLTYNDYGIEQETPQSEAKRQAVIELLRRMVARRVPIDALGIQSHISALATPANGDGPAYGPGLLRLLAGARQLGLQVFLTEMDVNDRASPANIPFRDATVAATYKHYLNLVLADPAVRAVLTWGITDKYTWLNHEDTRTDGQSERPLPFDTSGRSTPSFFALRDAFDGRPPAILRHP